MNILIWGSRTSNKTIIANALAESYRYRGHNVVVIEDDVTDSRPNEDDPTTVLTRLKNTKGKATKHSIAVTQGLPHQIYGFYDTEDRPRFFDYYVHTTDRPCKELP